MTKSLLLSKGQKLNTERKHIYEHKLYLSDSSVNSNFLRHCLLSTLQSPRKHIPPPVTFILHYKLVPYASSSMLLGTAQRWTACRECKQTINLLLPSSKIQRSLLLMQMIRPLSICFYSEPKPKQFINILLWGTDTCRESLDVNWFKTALCFCEEHE